MEYTWFTCFIARILHFQVPKVKIQHTDIKLLFKPIGFCYDIDLFTVTFYKKRQRQGDLWVGGLMAYRVPGQLLLHRSPISKKQNKNKQKSCLIKRITLCLLLCLICIGLLQEYFNWTCFIRIWRCEEIIRSTEIYFEDMLKHQ